MKTIEEYEQEILELKCQLHHKYLKNNDYFDATCKFKMFPIVDPSSPTIFKDVTKILKTCDLIVLKVNSDQKYYSFIFTEDSRKYNFEKIKFFKDGHVLVKYINKKLIPGLIGRHYMEFL